MNILTLNIGSSSIKYVLFKANDTCLEQAAGHIETPRTAPWTWSHQGTTQTTTFHTLSDALDALFESFDPQPDLIAHRIVHGGADFTEPTLIGPDELEQLMPLATLAPEHNPKQFECIQHCLHNHPKLQNIALFDTAFHQTLPPVTSTYAIPESWRTTLGLRRFGFHGLSHEYVSQRAARALKHNSITAISCHLGNGASLCAIQNGKSIDTSMGYTPLAGLVMGTRSGDIDPEIIQAVHDQTHTPYAEIFKQLNTQSGLYGLCGDSDLRTITQRCEAQDATAQLAFDTFCYRIKAYIGAYTAILGPIDALIFTGGIGEHSPRVRQLSTNGLSHVGITLNAQRNASTTSVDDIIDLTGSDSSIKVYAIHTDEARHMAQKAQILWNTTSTH